MSRVKIQLPEHFPFTAIIPIRITDINYGGHVGNDSILSLLHEARMQFLKKHGYTEMDFEGVSMIMGDVAIEFKSELFYGDQVTAAVAIHDFTAAGFNIFYKLSCKEKTVAMARTGMVCFNYDTGKVVRVPARVVEKFGI